LKREEVVEFVGSSVAALAAEYAVSCQVGAVERPLSIEEDSDFEGEGKIEFQEPAQTGPSFDEPHRTLKREEVVEFVGSSVAALAAEYAVSCQVGAVERPLSFEEDSDFVGPSFDEPHVHARHRDEDLSSRHCR